MPSNCFECNRECCRREEHVLKFRGVCLQAGLQFLALQNVGCSINACSALRELLTNSAHLTGLHFFNNMSDNAGASSIAGVNPLRLKLVS